MACRTLRFWFSLLLLCFYPLLAGCQQCGRCPRQYNIDYNVDLSYVTEGEESFIEYTDSKYGHMRVKVPRFFFDYSKERILNEIHISFEDEAWSERVLLEIFFYAVTYGADYKPKNWTQEKTGLEGVEGWMQDSVDVCQWEGVVCGPLAKEGALESEAPDYKPPCHAVTSIDLMEANLSGTLPTELFGLDHLHRLNLNENLLHGTIPTEYGSFLHLRFMDLGDNKLTGTIPHELAALAPTLEELWLEKNSLTGTIDYGLCQLTNCRFLDLSENHLTGTIPPEIGHLTSLGSLFLENNKLNGTIVPELGMLHSLRVLDVGVNDLTGLIPTEIGYCTSMIDFNIASNRLTGTIPPEIFFLTNLEVLMLSENEFRGLLPEGDDKIPGRNITLGLNEVTGKPAEAWGYSWGDFSELVAFAVDRNSLVGTLPPQLLYGLAPSLTSLDIGYNFFTGTMPPEIGKMTNLKRFNAPYNFFVGTVPEEIGKLKELSKLNITSNLFTGTVPEKMCNPLFLSEQTAMLQEFGCDAISCPPGTFHPDGAASMVGGCQPCPKTDLAEEFAPKLSTVLGRASCESALFLYADQNVDGEVSQREALRYLFYELNGPDWGDKYIAWADLKIDECELHGITCNGCGEVSKIDLSDANLCSTGKNNTSSSEIECGGLPVELKYFNGSLEAFVAPRRPYLSGSLPSEMGGLSELKILQLQGCPLLTGTIPSEFGKLTKLQLLDLSGDSLNGTLPSEMFEMEMLEKINLSLNPFEGTIPSEIGNLRRLKDLRISRAGLNGTLPLTIGDLRSVENLEIYGNAFTGSLPSLQKLKALKRIDIFNNKLTGPIPESLGELKTLQIIHLKKNQLSGEIPSNLGTLPALVWLDASLNLLSGTIPETFGSSRMLKDLRLHGNRLYDPIPQSLCENLKLNGGSTAKHGCDGIICPLGTFLPPEQGYAKDSVKCEKCPTDETTLYLGSTECVKLDQTDLLSMLFDVLDGDSWPEEFKRGWKDENLSYCEWAGVTCDEKQEIIGLAIPRTHN